MRVILLFILGFAFSYSVNAQVYLDPTTSGAILATGSMHNRSLDKTNDQLTLIQRGQFAVTGQLTVANDLQNKIYVGLSEVSGAVKSLMGVKQASDYVIRIYDNVRKTIEVAQGDPILLLFAERNARDFKLKAVELSAYISSFALQGGKNNLMDAGERARIIKHVVDELRMLNGLAYGMHRAMYYAQMNGILRSLNPWQTWVNRDAQIARQVVRDMDYLD